MASTGPRPAAATSATTQDRSVTDSAHRFNSARILGNRTVHQVAGEVTGGLQRTVCGLTRRLLATPADPVTCRHCVRLTGTDAEPKGEV